MPGPENKLERPPIGYYENLWRFLKKERCKGFFTFHKKS